MDMPNVVYVGRFRKNGRTAITSREKTAAAWKRDGHEVHAYAPQGSDSQAPGIDVTFWDKAFLALLPAAMTIHGWKLNDVRITSGEDRIQLAAIWAVWACRTRAHALSESWDEDETAQPGLDATPDN